MLSAPRLFPALLELDGRVVIAAGAGFEGSDDLPLDLFDPSTGEVAPDPNLPSGPVGAGYFVDSSGLGFAGGLGFDPSLAPLGPALDTTGRIHDGMIVPMSPLRSAAGWPLVSELGGRVLVISGYLHGAGSGVFESSDDAHWLVGGDGWASFAVAGPQGRPRGACVSLAEVVHCSGGVARPEESSGVNASVRELSIAGEGRLSGRHIVRLATPRAAHVMFATGEEELTVAGGVFQDRSRPPVPDRLPYVDLPPIAGVERTRVRSRRDFWERAGELPHPLAHMAGVRTPAGALLLLGGTSSPLSRAEGRTEVLIRDVGEERWRVVDAGLIPRYAHGVLLLEDGSILIAGGLSAPGEPVLEVERLRF